MNYYTIEKPIFDNEAKQFLIKHFIRIGYSESNLDQIKTDLKLLLEKLYLEGYKAGSYFEYTKSSQNEMGV